jgi:hypothetical protein
MPAKNSMPAWRGRRRATICSPAPAPFAKPCARAKSSAASIAHVKLALKLGETGYQFREGDRLHLYLTNTLEPPSDIADASLADLFGPLAREAQEANSIKRTHHLQRLP